MDSVLDPGRAASAVHYPDGEIMFPCNLVGQPRTAMPTLMATPGSYAFRNRGPRMILGEDGTLSEPNAMSGSACWDMRRRT